MLLNYIEQKIITQKNRGLFAKKSFKEFETIAQINPIAIAVLSKFKDKICNYCLEEKQLVRCSQCKSFYYCSGNCQKSDWKIHKQQCKIYCKMVFQKKLSVKKQITAQFALNLRCFLLAQKDQQFKKKLISMLSLQDIQNPQKLKYFQEMGVVILQNLSLEKSAQNLGQILSIINRVSINTFTIQDPLYNYDGLAIGLYYPANLLNHQCIPNCTQIFDGRTLKILSNKQINQGQELTISYVNILDSIQERKISLENHYLFKCFCQLCQVQKMLNSQIFYLFCPSCQQKSIKKSTSENSESKYSCSSCQKPISQQQYINLINKAKELAQNVIEVQDYAQAKKYFFALKKIYDFRNPIFGKLIRELYLKALSKYEIEKQISIQRKILQEAQILLKEQLNQMKVWYRLDEQQQLNLLFIWKYAEMGKLAYNLGKIPKAFEYTEKAIILSKKINYKTNLKELKQLQARFNQLKIQMSIAKTKVFQK